MSAVDISCVACSRPAVGAHFDSGGSPPSPHMWAEHADGTVCSLTFEQWVAQMDTIRPRPVDETLGASLPGAPRDDVPALLAEVRRLNMRFEWLAEQLDKAGRACRVEHPQRADAQIMAADEIRNILDRPGEYPFVG